MEVHLEMIGDVVKVKIDRPIGSYHPEYRDIRYQVNYGYIEGVIAPDGEEQDAYVLGTNEVLYECIGKIIAVIHRNNDIEEKWVVAIDEHIYTYDEIKKMVDFQEKYFDIEILM